MVKGYNGRAGTSGRQWFEAYFPPLLRPPAMPFTTLKSQKIVANGQHEGFETIYPLKVNDLGGNDSR
jgi:hypothetical protein